MRALLVAVSLLAGVSPALAQSAWTDRVRVSVNAGPQADTTLLSESVVLRKYVEAAPVTARTPSAMVPFFDLGVAVRLAGSFGVGVAYSVVNDKGTADIAADIPHPFYFDRRRAIAGQAAGVRHAEKAAHVDAVYLVAWPRLDLALMGGASYIQVEQDFVTDVAFVESFPYDTAAFLSATLVRASASKAGYNAGVDLTWKFSPAWGVGGLVRFSRARVPLGADGLDFGKVDAGGLQAGAGLRLMF
jgi:hypothetical protein